jgi:hypothetical protein
MAQDNNDSTSSSDSDILYSLNIDQKYNFYVIEDELVIFDPFHILVEKRGRSNLTISLSY